MAAGRRVLLLSNSTSFGDPPLAYASDIISEVFKRGNVKSVTFIPYALNDFDAYAAKIQPAFERMGYKFESIHTRADPVKAIEEADAIYVGGGNTFMLLQRLYNNKLLDPIRTRVNQGTLTYLGASAGTNVATLNICTTNDMPIVHPPSLDALGFVPFNINPHYIEADPNSKHMGETRDERICQYHELEDTPPVLGLPEGNWVLLEDSKITVGGNKPARLFTRNKPSQEIQPKSDISFLLNA